MKPIIYIVEDEKLALDYLTEEVVKICPKAQVYSFRKGAEAIAQVPLARPDIVFLDINLGGMNGLEVAERLKESNPRVNIIFSTGYSEYMPEAFEVHASGYMLKPITEEMIKKELDNLLWPVCEEEKKLEVRALGRFEAFSDGIPLQFQYVKTKELLAYLIDARGRWCTNGELLDILWSEEGGICRHESYLRNLISDLRGTLKKCGLENVLLRKKGQITLNTEMIDCDYYQWLTQGNGPDPAPGEYMSQYSWGEVTLGKIINEYGANI